MTSAREKAEKEAIKIIEILRHQGGHWGRRVDCVADALESKIKRIEDYEEMYEDHKRLVRELDRAVFGKEAAKQASLCDLVGPIKKKIEEAVEALRELLADVTSEMYEHQTKDWTSVSEAKEFLKRIEELEKTEESVLNLSHPNIKLLMKEKAELEKNLAEAVLLLKDVDGNTMSEECYPCPQKKIKEFLKKMEGR